MLRIDQIFFDPSLWTKIESFRAAKSILKSLRVTNDNAERTVFPAFSEIIAFTEHIVDYLPKIKSNYNFYCK